MANPIKNIMSSFPKNYGPKNSIERMINIYRDPDHNDSLSNNMIDDSIRQYLESIGYKNLYYPGLYSDIKEGRIKNKSDLLSSPQVIDMAKKSGEDENLKKLVREDFQERRRQEKESSLNPFTRYGKQSGKPELDEIINKVKNNNLSNFALNEVLNANNYQDFNYPGLYDQIVSGEVRSREDLVNSPQFEQHAIDSGATAEDIKKARGLDYTENISGLNRTQQDIRRSNQEQLYPYLKDLLSELQDLHGESKGTFENLRKFGDKKFALQGMGLGDIASALGGGIASGVGKGVDLAQGGLEGVRNMIFGDQQQQQQEQLMQQQQARQLQQQQAQQNDQPGMLSRLGGLGQQLVGDRQYWEKELSKLGGLPEVGGDILRNTRDIGSGALSLTGKGLGLGRDAAQGSYNAAREYIPRGLSGLRDLLSKTAPVPFSSSITSNLIDKPMSNKYARRALKYELSKLD